MENNYEQKYKKALDNARLMYDAGNNDVKHIVGQLFPELAESENERIRKALITFFSRFPYNNMEDAGINAKDVISWLEKQAEHANFLSKIQVGDKVTRNEAGVLVNLSQLKRVAKPEENKGNIEEISPNWSEEDECYMSECIGAIATKDGWSFEEKRKTKHWLKSLKDRVGCEANCTTTKEWSEEEGL